MLMLIASYNSLRLWGLHFTFLILTVSTDSNQDIQDWETLAVQPLLK